MADTSAEQEAVKAPEISQQGDANNAIKHVKPVIPEGMTKSAYKRQLKAEKMAAQRPAFIAKRAEKRKELRAAKRARKAENIEPSPEEVVQHPHEMKRPRLNNKPIDMRILVDCDFEEHLMKEGERVSLARQLVRAYAENRRALFPAHMSIVGFKGPLRRIFDENMHGHWRQFKDIEFSELSLKEYLAQNNNQTGTKTVYLSSDAETELNELDPKATYIIGGIVDKGRHVNLCHDRAKSLGIETARLPIGKFIKLSGRRVLTTSHVVELLSRWLEFKDWRQAFEYVLPARKVLESHAPGEKVESASSESG